MLYFFLLRIKHEKTKEKGLTANICLNIHRKGGWFTQLRKSYIFNYLLLVRLETIPSGRRPAIPPLNSPSSRPLSLYKMRQIAKQQKGEMATHSKDTLRIKRQNRVP